MILMEKNAVSYIAKTTSARLNYRTRCEISSETLAGVLEKNTAVKAVDGWERRACGHVWNKIKIGRRHYFVCAEWLE